MWKKNPSIIEGLDVRSWSFSSLVFVIPESHDLLEIDETSPCKEVRVVAEVLCTPTLRGRLVQSLEGKSYTHTPPSTPPHFFFLW